MYRPNPIDNVIPLQVSCTSRQFEQHCPASVTQAISGSEFLQIIAELNSVLNKYRSYYGFLVLIPLIPVICGIITTATYTGFGLPPTGLALIGFGLVGGLIVVVLTLQFLSSKDIDRVRNHLATLNAK